MSISKNDSSDSFSGKNLPEHNSALQIVRQCFMRKSQVYLGTVASRRTPRPGIQHLIHVCDAAGIRFVQFSALPAARATIVSDILGLDTDWNTSISLKPTNISGN